MTIPAFSSASDGVFRIAGLHERHDSDCSSRSSRDSASDSESSMKSKDESKCLCQICARDGACALVTGAPLERELRHRNIISGSKVLMVVISALTVVECVLTIALWISSHRLADVMNEFGGVRICSALAVKFLALGILVYSRRRPRLAIYMPTVTLWIMYNAVFWLFLPLKQLQELKGGFRFYSPDATGYIALHGNMWLMFLLPLVVPECRFMSVISRCWIGLFFVIISVMIALEPNPDSEIGRRSRYRYNFDLTVGVLFLGAGFLIVSGRKRVMEEEQLAIFRLDQQKKGVSENMFNILGCMVPHFLLVPMLKDPNRSKPIAYNVDRASVLFISFVGFDQMVRGSMSPHQLLIFLNRYFTQIDNICASCGVLKIETVADEYVCAVGVVPPDDPEQDLSQGHQSVLGQLVNVAFKVMELQNQPEASDEPVTFQMGIHTGPVVAGVVGQRLPRFRLFGDTINTAARMMQKGLPGEVQFGEATRRELPRWAAVEERGQVEMKGKGLMTTYLLRPGGHRGSGPALSPAGTLQVQRAHSSTGTGTLSAPASGIDLEMGRSFSQPCGSGVSMQRGLTQILFDCRDGAEQDVDHERSEAHDAGGSASTDSLSFDDILEVLAIGGSMTDARRPDRFVSASRLVWSKRFHSSKEDTFRAWFHETCFCKNLVRRIRRLTKTFMGLTIMETLYLVCNRSASTSSFFEVVEEFRVYLICRVLGICILASWLSVVGCCSWVQSEARLIQRSMLLSWCALVALVFLSYNSLPFLFSRFPLTDETSFPLLGVSRNVVYLNCFPAIMVLMMVHPFTFVQSCAFPTIMAILMFIVQNLLWEDCSTPQDAKDRACSTLVLNNVLVKAIFLISSFVCTMFAYMQEDNLRDRHMAQCAVSLALRNVEDILGTLMPPLVLQRIRNDGIEARVQHHYSHATVVQSDLVGFTQLASTRDPCDVVKIISELFGVYDRLADKHGVYKVETVGDAYIAAQAEEPLSATNSPLGVVLFGLDMVQATVRWARNNSENVSCRVGVHTGECVGGVVGTDMQRYHLFGSIMNVLDLLESTAPAGRVQVSSSCKRAVERERMSHQEVSFRSEDVALEARNQEQLSTSKGELHSIAEVGGPTFLASRAASVST